MATESSLQLCGIGSASVSALRLPPPKGFINLLAHESCFGDEGFDDDVRANCLDRLTGTLADERALRCGVCIVATLLSDRSLPHNCNRPFGCEGPDRC